MTKSLVTGGCGFIGSHLVNRLVDLDHEVIVLDRVYPKEKNDKVKYYLQNLSENYIKYLHFFESVDNVFHLASDVSIPYCVEKPNESMANNTLATMNVLECSRIHKINKFIFSSTSAVYGNTMFIPSYEENQVQCLNTYSISKYTGEQLCKMYYELYGLKTISFRYFNVFGEGQHKTGQYAPVMSIFMRQKKNKEALTIIGQGYQTRDFVHVSDVVHANILASQKDLDTYGQVFNVGTGEGTEIQKIANLISNYQVYVPERDGEVLHSRANIDKIKNKLGWNYSINVLNWIEKIQKNG
jgi:nucleoside-diphosphate-sugar epimerase